MVSADRDEIVALLNSRPARYFSGLLAPALALIQSGEAKNYVVLNFVSHKGDPWNLILQRDQGESPLDHLTGRTARTR